jgi:hypothetical protein
MVFSAFLAFLGLWAFMAFSLLSAFWRTFELKKPKRNQSGA